MTLGKRAGIASALVRGGRRAVKCAKIIFLDDMECFFHSAQAGFWAIVETTTPQTCLPTDQRRDYGPGWGIRSHHSGRHGQRATVNSGGREVVSSGGEHIAAIADYPGSEARSPSRRERSTHAVVRGQVEHSLTAFVTHVRIGAPLDEHLDHLGVTELSCH